MAIRGILAYNDDGELVEVSADAADKNNPSESEIEPVSMRDILLSGVLDGQDTAELQNLARVAADTGEYQSVNTGQTNSIHHVDAANFVQEAQPLIDDYSDGVNDYLVINVHGKGSFGVSSTLNLRGKDNICIRGATRGGIFYEPLELIWTGSNGATMIDATGVNYHEVSGLKLDGGGPANGVTGVQSGVAAGEKATALYEDIWVGGFGTALNLGPDGSTDYTEWLDDCDFTRVYIQANDTGIERVHAGHRFQQCTFAGNTVPVDLTGTSSLNFAQCLWSNNTRDLYIDAGNGLSNLSFFGCYFENSDNGVLEDNRSSTFTAEYISFHGCELHTDSTTALMDIPNIAGELVFFGGAVASDTGSKDITGDTFTTAWAFLTDNSPTITNGGLYQISPGDGMALAADVPGAAAGDLSPRQVATDSTNGRLVWKDETGSAYYVSGTAL